MSEPVPQTTMPPAFLRCDAPGCPDEMIMRQGGEQYCFVHAMERGNRERVTRGFPPVMIDDEGAQHVIQ